jgi:hypothetical protein
MPQSHLHFQELELFRDARLGLCTHLLTRPLLDPVELLVDIHLGGMHRREMESCNFCEGSIASERYR